MNDSGLLPLPAPIFTGIRFGDHHFSEPEVISAPFILDSLTGGPGVYVVLVQDQSQEPRPYRALYFGESENMQDRATTAHETHACWRREAGSALYRAFHHMPGSTRFERQIVESALIDRYRPSCNHRPSLDLSALLGESRF